MLILGIVEGHDANWAVVRDGQLLAAFEKERFSKTKHDGGDVSDFVPKTLDFLGINIEEVDLIATSEPVFRGLGTGITMVTGRRYTEIHDAVGQTVRYLGRTIPCISVPHHLAHASYARYTSPFSDVAVLTWDGGGDAYTEAAYSCATMSVWGDRLKSIVSITNCGIGSLWHIVSKAIFDDGNAAGKLMALAALGRPHLIGDLADRVLAPMRTPLQGIWSIKDCWPDEDRPPLLHGSSRWQEPMAQDVAYAVQFLTTQTCLALAQGAIELASVNHIATSGGVALNGYVNSALRELEGVDDAHVPPAVHDGGLAAGAALFAWHEALGNEYRPSPSRELAALGLSYTPDDVVEAARGAKLVSRYLGQEEAVAEAVDRIASGQVIGWYEGRSEHGPRALGQRSILARADSVTVRDRINQTIKRREVFRPLAPAVLASRAHEYFDIKFNSPFMLYIVDVLREGRQLLPGIVHRDGTARVQTVDPATSLGRICAGVGMATGQPVVINTSLNVQAPIAETPADAMQVLSGSGLDALIANEHLILRR